MQADLVSICIPTYNGAEHLLACLDSACAQRWEPLEILVVDDGSSDATIEIVGRYAAADKRIRLLRNPTNLGLVGNWNRCVELARGEWIKFLFQDDYLHPDCIARMLDGPRQRFIACDRAFVFENVAPSVVATYERFAARQSLAQAFDRSRVSPEAFCAAVARFLADNFVGEPTSVLLHRSLFDEFGLFDRRWIQICDHEYWCRVGSQEGLKYVPQTLAYFRVHDKSASANNSTARDFAMSTGDSLTLLHAFAHEPTFELLRQRSRATGVDYDERFRERLLYEQLWGRLWFSPEWRQFINEWPQMRLPLPQQIKRRLKLIGRAVSSWTTSAMNPSAEADNQNGDDIRLLVGADDENGPRRVVEVNGIASTAMPSPPCDARSR